GKKAGLSTALNNIVTLMAACSQYFFFMSWSSTDAMGVCLILFSLGAAIDIINKKENIRLLKLIATCLLFCSAFFFRYMYLPISILLPCFILFSGIFLKNRDLKIGGLNILAVSAFLLAGFFVFSLSTSGNSLYITNVGRGIFMDQLKKCYPFLPASFINIDFGAQLIQSISGIDYSRTILFLKIINPIILALLLFLMLKYIRSHKNSLHFSTHSLLILIGAAISITIILLLVYLSLTYKEQSWGFYRWTHVQDPRYFSFIYAFIPLLFFVCLYHYRSSFRSFFTRLFFFIAIVCFATELTHGVYYNIKIAINHKDLAY